MTAVLADVILPHKSGLVEDNVVNTFTFATAAPLDDTVAAAIATDLANFYNVVPAGHNAIAGVIGAQISRTVLTTVKFYDLTGHLDGSPHGSPDFIKTFVLGARNSGGVDMPSEVCAALSFRAAYADDPEFSPIGRPRARDRGRVYIGPLSQAVFEQDGTTGKVVLTQSFRETMTTAGAALRDAVGHAWSVWSRKNATVEPVTTVWCDNAPDIQRRRGEAPTVRTTL